MRLLIIRHAEAEEATADRDDADRRLTSDGNKEMRKVAKGLREIAPRIDAIATSPLVRARETAEIVANVLDVDRIVEQPALAPGGDKQELLDWLLEQAPEATVAVVGHEPYLSTLASLLVSGGEQALLSLKKGACCLIEFERRPSVGAGVLAWLMQPKQLRKLD